jgi:hypothetical protein
MKPLCEDYWYLEAKDKPNDKMTSKQGRLIFLDEE